MTRIYDGSDVFLCVGDDRASAVRGCDSDVVVINFVVQGEEGGV